MYNEAVLANATTTSTTTANQTSESQIDHILIFIPEKSNLEVKFKEQLCLKDDPSNLSSHDVIVRGQPTYN